MTYCIVAHDTYKHTEELGLNEKLFEEACESLEQKFKAEKRTQFSEKEIEDEVENILENREDDKAFAMFEGE